MSWRCRSSVCTASIWVTTRANADRSSCCSPGTLPSRRAVLRATQFHEFAAQLLGGSPGPVALLPTMRSQPIAAREVGLALVDLAGGPAVGMAPELAGPQPETVADMARRYLRATGSRRRVLQVRLPGRAGRQAAAGGLLPTGPGPRGVQTFEQWAARPRRPVSEQPALANSAARARRHIAVQAPRLDVDGAPRPVFGRRPGRALRACNPAQGHRVAGGCVAVGWAMPDTWAPIPAAPIPAARYLRPDTWGPTTVRTTTSGLHPPRLVWTEVVSRICAWLHELR